MTEQLNMRTLVKAKLYTCKARIKEHKKLLDWEFPFIKEGPCALLERSMNTWIMGICWWADVIGLRAEMLWDLVYHSCPGLGKWSWLQAAMGFRTNLLKEHSLWESRMQDYNDKERTTFLRVEGFICPVGIPNPLTSFKAFSQSGPWTGSHRKFEGDIYMLQCQVCLGGMGSQYGLFKKGP